MKMKMLRFQNTSKKKAGKENSITIGKSSYSDWTWTIYFPQIVLREICYKFQPKVDRFDSNVKLVGARSDKFGWEGRIDQLSSNGVFLYYSYCMQLSVVIDESSFPVDGCRVHVCCHVVTDGSLNTHLIFHHILSILNEYLPKHNITFPQRI